MRHGSSRGDWTVDRRKHPDGLGPLVGRAAALGLEFGPWFAPEMVSPDGDLLRRHPEWARDRPTIQAGASLPLPALRPESAPVVELAPAGAGLSTGAGEEARDGRA